ncbi:hypothetical protein [Nostoc foliaceum]|uniref:Uncharacterized protein n=1 Tax=Nostoc foliaceum FACHB-393 TaxID=2692915 RepID=A0ABR8IM57_9NOSO|nr:hypothetical protein [Nostoc foliaceum]MBD2651798.1 hypothetical protein [Nostoc foliaceum FACHB-393]
MLPLPRRETRSPRYSYQIKSTTLTLNNRADNLVRSPPIFNALCPN